MAKGDNVVLVPVVAGVVLRKGETFLLVEETDPPHRGLWNLPGGRVEAGESIEQGARREAREETGFEVRLGRKLPIHQNTAEAPIRGGNHRWRMGSGGAPSPLVFVGRCPGDEAFVARRGRIGDFGGSSGWCSKCPGTCVASMRAPPAHLIIPLMVCGALFATAFQAGTGI
jgi:8-oxo-dGTP pyrophosphatase MutT (NUDIX family)